MTNVLCALEDTEGERGEEVTRRQQTSGWSQGEAGVAAQEVVHLLQLRDSRLDEDLLLLELGKDLVVLAASVLWHQVLDDAEHGAPSVVLGLGVVDVGNRIAAEEEKKLDKSR